MDAGRAQKRRRTVTTCTECARRKQRCNREAPCQHCLQRGVPDRCNYIEPARKASIDNSPKISPPDESSSVRSTDHTGSLEGTSGAESEADFPAQAGYLLATRDNSSVAYLRQSLREDAPSPRRKSINVGAVPSSLRQQYHNIVKRLPPDPLCDQLLEVYFTEANWHFQCLDQYFFNESYTTWRNGYRSPTRRLDNFGPQKLEMIYFPALIFQVLAVALQFLPSHGAAAKALSQYTDTPIKALSQDWSTAGAEIITCLGRSNATYAGVEQDLMRSLWLKNEGQGATSWQLQGAAIRQAQELGLHALPKFHRKHGETIQETATRAWRDERKRRMWIVLFTWDIHTATILGRPRGINLSDCTTDPPVDCDIPSDPSETFPGVIEADAPPSEFTARLFSFTLGKRYHEMYNIGIQRTNYKEYDKVWGFHQYAIDAVNGMPPYLHSINPDTSFDGKYPNVPRLRCHIQIIKCAYLMTLHRDHASVHPESRQAAINAASESLEAHDYMFYLLNPNQRASFTLSCYVVDATLLLASIALKSATTDVGLLHKADESLRKTISMLTSMEDRSPLARTGAILLKKCHKRVKDKMPDDGSLPSEVSPAANPLTPSLSSTNMDSIRDDATNFQNGLLEFDDRYRFANFDIPTNNNNLRASDFSLGLPGAANGYSAELFNYIMEQPTAFDLAYTSQLQ